MAGLSCTHSAPLPSSQRQTTAASPSLSPPPINPTPNLALVPSSKSILLAATCRTWNIVRVRDCCGTVGVRFITMTGYWSVASVRYRRPACLHAIVVDDTYFGIFSTSRGRIGICPGDPPWGIADTKIKVPSSEAPVFCRFSL